MDALDAILTRRSIRKFTGEIISDEDIKTIIKAGFAAPSAHNNQSWEFIIVKDMDRLNEIASFHPYAKMLPNAGCGIIVCGDLKRQKEEGFLVSDASAAIENMLIAINGINLGAVWCGIYPVPNLIKMIREILNIPEYIVPVGLIAVGYKTVEKPSWNRYDEEKVHINKW